MPAKTTSRFSEWVRKPTAGAALVMPGTVDSVVVLERDAGKRRDQMVRLLDGAPEDVRDAAIEQAADPGFSDIVASLRISNKRVDSYDTTFRPDGADVADFKRNPVVLFAHDAEAMPVARDIGVHVRGKGDGGEVIGVPRFAHRDINPFGDQVGRALACGLLGAASIGFEPTEWEIASERDDGESFMPPIDFIKWRLREYSIVPVPANADALVEGRKRMSDFGLTDADFGDIIERMIETVGGVFVPRSELESLRTAVRGTRVQIDLGAGGVFSVRAEPEPEEPISEEGGEEETKPDALPEDEDERASMTCPMCAYEGDADAFSGEPPAEVEDDAEARSDAAGVDGESEPRHAADSEEQFSPEVLAAAEATADIVEQIEIEETGRLP